MNDTPLHSSLWYRVAGLRPELVAKARLHRHHYRGKVWYLLQDPASNRVHRFTPAARLLLAAMDGRRSVQDLWQLAARKLGEEAPTQDELIQLLGQLHSADLLRTDVPPDALELFDRGRKEARAKSRRAWANPIAMKIPLWDPGRFLDRHASLWRWLWGRAGAAVWLAAVLPALVLLPMHWPDLTGNLSDRVLQADNLMLIALVFPIIKLLHEMGHATANHAAGGEVHDMGAMLLVFLPVPYVDASSANVLRSRWARARIGAAGMIVELFLAAVAFHVWTLAEPGLLRAVCFNVMLVAGVSTLIFNGNPLLRYDAYYILADLAELPNLATMSARHWGYLIKRHLLRMAEEVSPARDAAERAWFFWYGLLSAAYRTFVALAIALFIGTQFFFFGVLLALWSLFSMGLMPIGKALKSLAETPATRDAPVRVWGLLGAAVAACVIVLVAVPVPYRSQAEGVVWLSDDASVRAGADGFFRGFAAEPGGAVAVGDLVSVSVDPQLDAQLRTQQARVDELEARYAAEFVDDRPAALIVQEQLEQERQSLARLQERAAGLQVRARTAGRLEVTSPDDWPGRYVRKGDVIGWVINDRAPVVRVVLDQATVELVDNATRNVELRLAGALEQPRAGRIVRQVPAGAAEAPSLALTAAGGGVLAADPRDPEGRRTLERIFELDVSFDEAPAGLAFGQRVHVRFSHPPAPAAVQAARAVRRLFLRHFQL